MKVTIVKKAYDKDDLISLTNGRETLSPKGSSKVDAAIEKEIVLTSTQLAEFESDLLDDSEIVKAHRDLMRVDGNGVWHCIAITADNAKYRILVESEGYDYARYTAIVEK